MAIEKNRGVGMTAYERPARLERAAEMPRRDTFVLRGLVQHVELARRRFALIQDGHTYSVGWSAATEFIGTEAAAMEGLEVCVKGKLKAGDFEAESIIAVC